MKHYQQALRKISTQDLQKLATESELDPMPNLVLRPQIA